MILCIGEAVIDMVQTPVSGLGDVYYPIPGGCAYNISVAIGRLGTPAGFIGRICKSFFGDMQVKRLRENNVNVDYLIRCPENPVLAFIKAEEGKDPQYTFYEEGTADRLLSKEELPLPLPDDITGIVFGSISMVMEPIATVIESLILNEASRKKRLIAFDPNIRPYFIKDRTSYLRRFEVWTGASCIVKISLEDLQYIRPNSLPEEALYNFIELGARLAIVTLGSQGCIAILKRENGNLIKVNVPGINVPNLFDTVGAGDTFLGALLSWLDRHGKMSPNALSNLNEKDLNEALIFANKAAAIVCSRRGADPPFPEEIN